MRAGDADFDGAVLVGNHSHRSDFRAGAGGGGYCYQRQHRAGHFELAVIVRNNTAVGEQQCDDLGSVQTTATANPDDHIG